MNVRTAVIAKKQSTLQPLTRLIPFILSTSLQLAWLYPSSPAYPVTSAQNIDIIHSPLFVAFICAWGLQFAHQVGRMILAHVTSTPFPMWDWIWIWSIIGAVDANLPILLDRFVVVVILSLSPLTNAGLIEHLCFKLHIAQQRGSSTRPSSFPFSPTEDSAPWSSTISPSTWESHVSLSARKIRKGTGRR